MTEAELIDLICKNPNSLYAQCYRLGRKMANLELTKEIERMTEKMKTEVKS